MFGGIAAKASGNDAPRWRWPTLASRRVWPAGTDVAVETADVALAGDDL
jgi:hypothetical protein